MDINIRQEKQEDYKIVENIIKLAFENEEYSDHKEHFLVEKLRKSNSFIKELSLVAEINGKIVGHILFTKIIIKGEDVEVESLALAPVSVLPEYQGKGIGSRLITEGLKIAKDLGFLSVILLGHPSYYQRFGFYPTSKWNIKSPFDVDEEFFMGLELKKGSLENINGIVIYPDEFLN